ncbi:alpha/beta fold hydrolase [Streptomyces sp. MC1]|uniref:alpha/beta fold hydrolase n=1 Tax=unclassified Streptomyces TaxID=2593676 RepID=UPI00068AC391|nr:MULTISPECIES: alpha/beta hydrolase [unclassified Streptomyces]KOV71685.1 hydrolase [Streptomyces sp. NRRL WC-3723]MBG7697124.1 alpha/beta fold hydrolase [Streptomyces sp. MC1]
MLAYDIRGSGPGLVLLHGIGSSAAETWGPLVDGLAATHTVVLPDLPGSGRSPLPVGPLAASTVADQVVATALAAGVRDFVIAGASLGAAVAVRVAARHPGRVRGLFTLAGFARPRTTLWLSLEMWASLHARRDERLNPLLTSLSFSEEYLTHLTPREARQLTAKFAGSAPGTAQQIALALGIDVHGDLPAVAAPALVVASPGDRLVVPEHSLELAEGIPGARLAAVKGGHAATIEEPERTLEILAGFLRDIRRHHGEASHTVRNV